MQPICEPVPEVASTGRKLTPRLLIALGACGCLAGAGFLFAVDPSHHAVYPQCQLFKLTGFFCAGCGATRALYALVHGRVLDALHDNVLFVAALPFILFWFGRYFALAWLHNTWPKVETTEVGLFRWTVAVVATMLTFTLLRNLPWSAFDWLRPLP